MFWQMLIVDKKPAATGSERCAIEMVCCTRPVWKWDRIRLFLGSGTWILLQARGSMWSWWWSSRAQCR